MSQKTKRIILFSTIAALIAVVITLVLVFSNKPQDQDPNQETVDTQTVAPSAPTTHEYVRTSTKSWEDAVWVGQTQKENIRVIHFVKEKSPEVAAEYAWVFDGFTCYLENDELYFMVGANVLKIENESMARAFCGFDNLEQLTGIEMLDLSAVRNVDGIFQGNSKLKEIDISKWQLQNVYSANDMFADCTSLTLIDMSQLDMSKLQTANRMFAGCKQLANLSLPIMPNVEYLDEALKRVGIESSYVCEIRGQLDLNNCVSAAGLLQNTRFESYGFAENFKTEKLENASSMFKEAAISQIDLSNWKTDNLKDVSEMFADVDMLETVCLDNWNLPNISDMSNMFFDCYNLKEISINATKTNMKIKSTQNMFANCDSLQSLDLSLFNNVQIGSTIEMFKNCKALQKVICSGFEANVSDRMFENCKMIVGQLPFDPGVIDGQYANANGYFRNEE